jgi:transcription elongation factor Elf1
MQIISEYICAFCGESNVSSVDLSAGMQQSYIEDCQVCCSPNVLYIRVDENTLEVEIDSDPEN